jgi:hypothetical protein
MVSYMKNRKAVETYLYSVLTRLTGGNKQNANIYKKKFSTMTDKAFDEWMTGVKDKKISIPIFIPNTQEISVDVKAGYKIAEELGFSFFQKFTVPATDDVPEHLSSVPALVMLTPVKRPSQILTKKLSVEKDDKKVDLSTGQATGESAPSSISFPEINQIVSLGLTETANELSGPRGGDQGAYMAMVGQLETHGATDLKTAAMLSTGAGSTKTLKAYLVGKQLETNT